MKRAAGLLVFRRLGGLTQYLLLKASYGDKHWTPPKGHVDPGESEWVTALRETKEEAGIDETDLQIFQHVNQTLEYMVKGKKKTVIYWLARLKDPHQTIRVSDEHTDLKWLEIREAKDISGYDDFCNMLDKFNSEINKIVTETDE